MIPVYHHTLSGAEFDASGSKFFNLSLHIVSHLLFSYPVVIPVYHPTLSVAEFVPSASKFFNLSLHIVSH